MANVQVIQRNAHLAGAVKLEYVSGKDGRLAKATVTAISNNVRGSGDAREQEATAIQWTLWGAQAENAANYLVRGSHVNIVGRLRNNNYERDGETVYAWGFTVEEIDYLDSRAESEARRGGSQEAAGPEAKPRTAKRPARAEA
ncbi:single-stranded DNA-binding protein [Pelomonas sp. Root1217]|uniref:single-stranded DNA-binding protein n=1 Tax=Pelomonas sp. Root1217 TaxID=1736430 RepID=UPI00070BCD7E|nr:single-stranded DNA-binding protein [Pelomonas sp. Root1217]KQV49516.1 single-stranded DNA-binding protein [Pelomonas sp. Root1217]